MCRPGRVAWGYRLAVFIGVGRLSLSCFCGAGGVAVAMINWCQVAGVSDVLGDY